MRAPSGSTVLRTLDVSSAVARSGPGELADAGVLARRAVERGTTGYSATEVFDLLTWTERRLASTRWGTRVTPPDRTVPAPPVGT